MSEGNPFHSDEAFIEVRQCALQTYMGLAGLSGGDLLRVLEGDLRKVLQNGNLTICEGVQVDDKPEPLEDVSEPKNIFTKAGPVYTISTPNGELKFDQSRAQVYFPSTQVKAHLTRREGEMLTALIHSPGGIITRGDLLKTLYPDDVAIQQGNKIALLDMKNLSYAITSRLRKKLGDDLIKSWKSGPIQLVCADPQAKNVIVATNHGPLTLNSMTKQVISPLLDDPTHLSPTLFKILELLIQNQGGVVSKEDIIADLYPQLEGRHRRKLTLNDRKILDINICRLKKRLGQNRDHVLIQTHRDLGYSLEYTSRI